MRSFMACTVLVALIAAYASAQDATRKDSVTDATVINLCGGRLSKMFAQCGTPVDMKVKRGSTPAEDDVLCDYGTYAFRVRDKLVRTCFLWIDWKGTVKGIKIGDTREDVVKVLGKPYIVEKDKDGVITDYGYDLKDLDADFFANFNKDGKVWRVEISLK
jgi:hypothetical protein